MSPPDAPTAATLHELPTTGSRSPGDRTVLPGELPGSRIAAAWAAASRWVLDGTHQALRSEAMHRRTVMAYVVSAVAILILVPMGVVSFYQGNSTLGVFDILVAALLAINVLYLRRGGRYEASARAGTALAGALFTYLFVTGGVANTGHLWFCTYPLFASFLLGSRRGAYVSLALLLPAVLYLSLGKDSLPFGQAYSFQFACRFVPAYLVVLAYSYLFEKLREISHERMTTKNTELAHLVGELQEKERALEAAHVRLEQRVRERTADLRCSNESLRREVAVRRKTEEALRSSHDRFTTVLDSIEANVYAADLETHEILFMNRRAKEEFGEDLIGQTCWRALRAADGPCENCTNPHLLDEEDRPAGVVTWEGRNQRSRKWYLHHDRAVRWVDGRFVRLQMATDITKRKAAERENARLQRELLQAQKMEAIGTLAGGIAHDLNNILSGVVGYPDLVLMDLPEGDRARRPLEAVKRSGEKCARIVQDMLTLARRGGARVERVTLEDVITEYLESPEFEQLRRKSPEVRVEHRPASEPTEIAGTNHHLSKTLMNLVVNAYEAMPSGGQLRLEVRRRRLGRAFRGYTTIPEGNYVVLRVQDTGVGVSESNLRRIFEPFFTTKVMGMSGSGLGMAVVWATVQDHGGHIDIRSREGEGTTFELYFPEVQVEGVSAAKPHVPTTVRGKGETILVVDDTQEQRELASMILSRLGYRVDTVGSGEEALTYLRANRPQMLLLDMVMEPGIDGLETWERAREIHPELRALIATGFAPTESVQRILERGAGGCLGKPYSIQEIGDAVRSVLDAPAPKVAAGTPDAFART